MDADLLNQLQCLCRSAYEASQTGEISDLKLLHKITVEFNSILRQSGGKQSISALVDEWAQTFDGVFLSSQMYAELGLANRTDKKAGDMALARLAKSGVIEPHGEKRGCWRLKNLSKETLDWEASDPNDTVNLIWPLRLEETLTIYPKNVIVLAGEKNSGKTAFLLEMAYRNAGHLPISFFSSEMGAQELGLRVRLFPEAAPFKKVGFFAASNGNFADLTEPDHVNIYDFLEMTDDFWKIAGRIRKIFDRLHRGVAIIAIQKKYGERLGRGGDFSGEKSRVYMTLRKGELKMEMVKNWKGKSNPNGRVYPFRLKNSSIFELKEPRLVEQGEM